MPREPKKIKKSEVESVKKEGYKYKAPGKGPEGQSREYYELPGKKWPTPPKTTPGGTTPGRKEPVDPKIYEGNIIKKIQEGYDPREFPPGVIDPSRLPEFMKYYEPETVFTEPDPIVPTVLPIKGGAEIERRIAPEASGKGYTAVRYPSVSGQPETLRYFANPTGTADLNSLTEEVTFGKNGMLGEYDASGNFKGNLVANSSINKGANLGSVTVQGAVTPKGQVSAVPMTSKGASITTTPIRIQSGVSQQSNAPINQANLNTLVDKEEDKLIPVERDLTPITSPVFKQGGLVGRAYKHGGLLAKVKYANGGDVKLPQNNPEDAELMGNGQIVPTFANQGLTSTGQKVTPKANKKTYGITAPQKSGDIVGDALNAAGQGGKAGEQLGGNKGAAIGAGAGLIGSLAPNLIDAGTTDAYGRYNTGSKAGDYAAGIGSKGLGGAAKGAAMGAAFGPVGIGIGAGVGLVGGGIMGGIKASKDIKSIASEKQAEELSKLQEAQRQRDQEWQRKYDKEMQERGFNKGGLVGKMKKMNCYNMGGEVDAFGQPIARGMGFEERQFNDYGGGDSSGLRGTASFKDGGIIEGAGTAKSDSIKAKVKTGSFIVPAENKPAAMMIRERVLKMPSVKKKANLNQAGGENIKVSDGEVLFSNKEVEKIENKLGEGVLEELAPNADKHEDMMEMEMMHMKDGGMLSSHKARLMLHEGKFDSDKQRRYFGWVAGGRKADGGKIGYAKGGPVEKRKVFDEANRKYQEAQYDKFLTRAELQKIESDYNKALVDYNKALVDYQSSIAKSKVPVAKKVEAIKQVAKEDRLPGETDAEYEAAKRMEAGYSAATRKEAGYNIAPPRPCEQIAFVGKKCVPSSLGKSVVQFTPAVYDDNITPPLSDAEVLANNKAAAEAEALNKSAMAYEKANPYTAPTETGLTSQQALGLAGQGRGLVSALTNQVLPRKQVRMGLDFLNKAGARPVDSLDPAYNEAVNRAQAEAKFGYTPEEQALINQRNQSALNAGRFAARNYAGGSAANAYNMERQAINESFGRGLQSAIAGRKLQLAKQERADEMVANKQELNRRLFQDTMNAWNQNQQAGSTLLSTGLANQIGEKRYADALASLQENRALENPSYNINLG